MLKVTDFVERSMKHSSHGEVRHSQFIQQLQDCLPGPAAEEASGRQTT